MRIGVLGCGAYGLALTSIMLDNKHEVVLWTRFVEERDKLVKDRCNKKMLPQYEIPEKVLITTNIDEAVRENDLIIVAIPAAGIDNLAQRMAPYINKNDHILIATKGIEQETGLFLHQVLSKHLKTRNIAAISGPSFAVDIITKMPIGLSIAGKKKETIRRAKKALASNYVKLRDSSDLIGIEACGAIKNVIAIAAGMLDGLGANDSTAAMLLTEATHDMMNILQAFHAKRKTVTTFAGWGDLLLTCTSEKSRNYSFGKLVGSKVSQEKIKKYLQETTVEGYYTLESIYKLLKDKKVSIPIIDIIYDIAVNGKNPELLLKFLVMKV